MEAKIQRVSAMKIVSPKPSARLPLVQAPVTAELVTPAEQRKMDQEQNVAMIPRSHFWGTPWTPEPLSKGASVSRATLEGFLYAAGIIHGSHPGTAKIELDHSMKKVYLQSRTDSLWCLVSMDAEFDSKERVTAAIPIETASSMVRAEKTEKVTIGINGGSFCIGTRSIKPDVDPKRIFAPLFDEWDARSVVPAFYFQDIVHRVASITRSNSLSSWQSSVLIDFEHAEIEGQNRILCTAIGMGGDRMHILQLPQIRTELAHDAINALPPTVTVPSMFFTYVQKVADKQWVGLEVAGKHLVAKGKDFACSAESAIEVRNGERPLVEWRSFNIELNEFLVDKSSLILAIDEMNSETCEVSFTACGSVVVKNANCRKQIPVQSSGAGRTADHTAAVAYSTSSLYDAVEACRGGIVRIGAGSKDAVTFRGEDEQFKAIIYKAGTQIQ